MNKSRAKRFTALLGKQLLQDATLETIPDTLQHSFQTAIDSLVEGELKSELIDNFDVHFKQLQRSLSNKLKKVGKKQNVEENLTSTASTSSDLRPLLVSGQLEQRLTEIQTIESFSQRCDHYIELLLASSTNKEWQIMILRNWTELWSADVLPIEEAAKIANCCILLITQEEAKLEWLRLCVKMFTSFVEKASSADNSKDNGHVRVKQLMWSCLYNYHQAACPTDPVKHGLTHEDLLSALLSLYIEYLLITEYHMTTVSDHVISLLYLLLGHARFYYFDVILQITVDKLPHDSLSILLSLCRYVVDKAVDCHMDHQSYIKYLCCVITGHRISEQIQTIDFKVKKLLPAPKGFVHWLCNSSPSLAKELNVKRFTADSDVATIVIHSPVKNIVEELLNLIDGDYAPEQPVTPAENDATDEVLVDNVQPSSPAGGDHFTDDETEHPVMNLSEDDVTDMGQTVDDVDDDELLGKQKEDNLLNEIRSQRGDRTPTNKIKLKPPTKQSSTGHKKPSGIGKRRKRRTASLGFFVDTTPGHKDCVPPITAGIKKKRKSWRTPQSQWDNTIIRNILTEHEIANSQTSDSTILTLI